MGSRRPDGEAVTGKEMCELVARYFADRFGKQVTPEQVWNCSPSGELAAVCYLYREAKQWYEVPS